MESLGIGFGGDHQTGTGVQDGLTGCRYGVSVDVDCAQVDLPVSVGAADRDSLRRGRIELGRIDITKHQLAVVLSVGYRSVWNWTKHRPTHQLDRGRSPVQSAGSRLAL